MNFRKVNREGYADPTAGEAVRAADSRKDYYPGQEDKTRVEIIIKKCP